MVTLKYFDSLKRVMRVEEVSKLGDNTLGKLIEAIERGDKQLELDLAKYMWTEDKRMHDTYTDWVFADLAWIARNYGEEEVPKVLRFVKETMDKPLFSMMTAMSTEDYVKLFAEFMRAHRGGPGETGDFKIWEEADRYVMEFDPCGSGGRMARGPLNGSGSRIKPPYNLGKTTKAYPWSWNKSGVPYYCVHCCVWGEIVPIEKLGYPSRINECPFDDFSKPSYWYFYKDPNLIPDKYFERVGFKKIPEKFVKNLDFLKI